MSPTAWGSRGCEPCPSLDVRDGGTIGVVPSLEVPHLRPILVR